MAGGGPALTSSMLATALETAASAAATAMETAAAAGADEDMAPPPCATGNEYNGDLGLRVSAIFVILIGSLFGKQSSCGRAGFDLLVVIRDRSGTTAYADTGDLQVPRSRYGRATTGIWHFPRGPSSSPNISALALLSPRPSSMYVPPGPHLTRLRAPLIKGTQLLAPANEALTNPCLTGPITEYPWPEGIVLMSIFVLFFVELMAMRYAIFDPSHEQSHAHDRVGSAVPAALEVGKPEPDLKQPPPPAAPHAHTPGEDHLGHTREHDADDEHEDDAVRRASLPRQPSGGGGAAADVAHASEPYSAQLTAIFILELGIVFHSVLIGLTLAVAGDEFRTLYAVLVFHQTFEGLGLGSRLAVVPWPKRARSLLSTLSCGLLGSQAEGVRRKHASLTPYVLAIGYALSTPVALAIGVAVRESLVMEGQTALLVQGSFDSISAGILIYTGLVELMAHEFMFSGVMRRARLRVVMAAFGTMCLGAGELTSVALAPSCFQEVSFPRKDLAPVYSGTSFLFQSRHYGPRTLHGSAIVVVV